MCDASGGVRPPGTPEQSCSNSRLPLSPSFSSRVVEALSPIARQAAEHISQSQYFDAPCINDLNRLSQELSGVKSQFSGDLELMAEVNRLTANIRRTINRKTSFSITDQGPFMIIMEGVAQKIGHIHSMNMGKLFHQANIEGIIKINRKGSNKIGIEFRTSELANSFLINERFSAANGYRTYIPQRLVTCRGIIKDIGDNITEDDFYNEAEAYITMGNRVKQVKILNVRRLNRRKRVQAMDGSIVYKTEPSSNYVVTFEGKAIPERVSVYNNEREVQRYISPVMLCLNCCRFGHLKSQCRGKTRCAFCSGDHLLFSCEKNAQAAKKMSCPSDHLNSGKICCKTDCLVNPKPLCPNCKDGHVATNRDCPEYARQTKINEAMQFYNLSFYEAAKLFPRSSTQHSGFIRREEEFPLVKNQTPVLPSTNSITSMHGRSSYVSAVKKDPRKRKQVSQGYDLRAHKQALLPSSSRVSTTTLGPSRTSFRQDSWSDSDMELGQDYDPVKENCNRFEDLKNFVKTLDRESTLYLRNILAQEYNGEAAGEAAL